MFFFKKNRTTSNKNTLRCFQRNQASMQFPFQQNMSNRDHDVVENKIPGNSLYYFDVETRCHPFIFLVYDQHIAALNKSFRSRFVCRKKVFFEGARYDPLPSLGVQKQDKSAATDQK